MFEIKIEDVLESKETSEERDFLKQARRLQICDIIESLSDAEFVELQRSVHQVFMKILKLQNIVKEGLEKGEVIGSIRNKLKEYFQYSSENSFYYRRQYLEIEKFLAELEEKRIETNMNPQEVAVLKCKFFEAIEQPNLIFQNNLQSAIYSRQDIEDRIYVRDVQLEGTKALTELLYDIKGEFKDCFGEEMKNLSNLQIYENLINRLLKSLPIELDSDTIEFIQDNVKTTPILKNLLQNDSEQEDFDSEVQEMCDSVQENFDLGKISEIIDFIKLLKYNVDALEKERMDKVIVRLKEMQKASNLTLLISKNSFKKEIIEILRTEQAKFRERRVKIQQESQNASLLDEEKDMETGMWSLLKKELGSGYEGYLLNREMEQFQETISMKSVDKTIQLMENLKIRSSYRKIFTDFLAANTVLTKNQIRKYAREGKLEHSIDFVVSKIMEKELLFGVPGNYNISKIDLYEELMAARGVREEEIVNALFVGNTKRKTY